LIIVGGGAAGFFAALRAKSLERHARVCILEASRRPLSKVRISGGGRCNVTHACFDLSRLLGAYPRGGKALRPIFQRFGPKDTVEWFRHRGVALKTEEDGRMFPVTDSSQTIVDCLLSEAQRLGVELHLGVAVRSVLKSPRGFTLQTSGELWQADRLLLATGSAPNVYGWLENLGHSPVPPVPSLFTFTIADPRLEGLAGVSQPWVRASLDFPTAIMQEGPLLITHWGLSGPAILKLSAWAARELAGCNYQATLRIDWLPAHTHEEVRQRLLACKKEWGGRGLAAEPPLPLPKRLWRALLGPEPPRVWRETADKFLGRLTETLKRCEFRVSAKGVFKEEFVVAGGVPLSELHLTTMESRVCPRLHVAGELLDVDGITGGFNFQNAWATGWIAGEAMGTS
jgi:predicted Rossmann fold flavoprotein